MNEFERMVAARLTEVAERIEPRTDLQSILETGARPVRRRVAHSAVLVGTLLVLVVGLVGIDRVARYRSPGEKVDQVGSASNADQSTRVFPFGDSEAVRSLKYSGAADVTNAYLAAVVEDLVERDQLEAETAMYRIVDITEDGKDSALVSAEILDALLPSALEISISASRSTASGNSWHIQSARSFDSVSIELESVGGFVRGRVSSPYPVSIDISVKDQISGVPLGDTSFHTTGSDSPREWGIEIYPPSQIPRVVRIVAISEESGLLATVEEVAVD